MAVVHDQDPGSQSAPKLSIGTVIVIGLAIYGVLLYCLVPPGG